MLSPYRVVDLSDDRGLICGQILADLGADVVRVEPPAGSRARLRGPFADDDSSPERSLTWWAYARGTRSVVVDLEESGDRRQLAELLKSADFLIESDDPGAMQARGLGYSEVSALNPGIVYVSISAFGQDGPKAQYAATDLTVAASSGALILVGDPGDAPLRVSEPQAFLHAGAEAAAAALIAHHERVRSGLGQWVDVSAQRAMTLATNSHLLATAVGDAETQRAAGGMRVGGADIRLIWPARDGYVSLTHLFGSGIGPFTRRLMEWIHEEGECDEATRDKDWIGYADLLLSGAEPVGEFNRVKQIIEDFTKRRTKAELFDESMRRRLLIAPIATVEEILNSPQFSSRNFWRNVERPESGPPLRYPGPFARAGRRPLAYRLRAPRVGEHTEEVRAELSSSTAEERASSSGPAPSEDHGGALADLKVLDLMWLLAGPSATRVLADYGATVVRVESGLRPDVARTQQPFYDGRPGAERSATYGNVNAGKLGLTLNLQSVEAREVVLDLVRWADVVTESFSPKVMPNWGLTYEELRAVNPGIVMLSSCLFGQDGPFAMLAGLGTMGGAMAGFTLLAGEPAEQPVGPFGAYTDYVAPRFTIAALLAALDHRRRTGEGQYIDQSQIESSLHFLTPALLDFQVNGRRAEACGNRDPQMAPHGIYPSAGDDMWIAAAVRDDSDWRSLCAAIEAPDLATDPRYADRHGRQRHADELDVRIAGWTRTRSAEAAEQALQAHGVPAHAIVRGSNAQNDRQLQHRGHFVEVHHQELGTAIVEGSRSQLSRTPAVIGGGAPVYGQHNSYVLTEILGYSDEQVRELVVAGALD